MPIKNGNLCTVIAARDIGTNRRVAEQHEMCLLSRNHGTDTFPKEDRFQTSVAHDSFIGHGESQSRTIHPLRNPGVTQTDPNDHSDNKLNRQYQRQKSKEHGG